MPGAGEEGKQEQKPNNENQPGADEKPKGAAGGADGGEDDLGEFADPRKALDEIKKLRKESADRRVKNKDLESKYNQMNAQLEKLKKAFGGEDEVDPEVKLKEIQGRNESLEVELSIMQLGRSYAIPVEHDDYFRFLLSSKMQTLGEGEELGEEEIKEIVGKVNAVAKPGAPKSKTGIDGKKPNPGESETITADTFKKMTTLERSDLYTKNPALYEKLRLESR